MNRLEPADKLNSERLRYFNGLAYQKGSSSTSNVFLSLGVADALEAGSGIASPWPSCSVLNSEPQKIHQGPLVTSTTPSDVIPGRRGGENESVMMKPVYSSGGRAPTFDDAHAPVATAYGSYLQPLPSPFKGRRRPWKQSEGDVVQNTRTFPDINSRSLQDHIVFCGEGMTTSVDASVEPLSLRKQDSVRGKLTVTEKRALWLQSGIAVAGSMLEEGLVAPQRIASMKKVGEEVFPASGSVAPFGKRHISRELRGENVSCSLQCSDVDAPKREIRGGNPLDKVMDKGPPAYIRRALAPPPAEILQSVSNPTRRTAVY